MFSFTVTSELVNFLLKRLLPLAGNDKNSIITLCCDQSGLKVYYNTSIDGSDSRGIFFEQLLMVDSNGSGNVSLDINQFLNLKIPNFVSEKKYPRCKEVRFDVLKSYINVSYDIYWSEGNFSKSTLKLPIFDKLDDLTTYDLLFSSYSKSLELHTEDFLKALSFINFIKGDAVSKDANGCLLKVGNNLLNLINTDSNIAIKYCCDVLQSNLLDFNVVVAPSVLNFIRNFISGSDCFKISSYRNSLYVEVESRKMLVPIMGKEYLIDNVEEFFNIEGKEVATLDLKILTSVIQVLVKKAIDIYKRLVFEFDSQLNIRSEEDYVENVPATIQNRSKIIVNGDFLLTCSSKLQQIDPTIKLYFSEESCRITLSTVDLKVIYLIQGMSLD